MGYKNSAIHKQYDISIGKYGFEIPKFSNCSSELINDELSSDLQSFEDMLSWVSSGNAAPQKYYQVLKSKKIHLQKTFFKDFLESQSKWGQN